MRKPATIEDQIASQLFWAKQCIAAYRTAIESLSPTSDSEGTLLLRQIDKRFPDFKPVTIHDKENHPKKSSP